MTVTFLEAAVIFFSFLLIGFVAGYFISRKLLKRNIITVEDLNLAKQNIVSLQAQLEGKNEHIARIEKELVETRNSYNLLNAESAAKEQQILNLKEQMEEKKTQLLQLNEKFNEEFQKIANQVFLNNSGEFNKQTADRLKEILTPFKEQIDKFEKKIDDSRTQQIQESTSLKTQISQLATLNTSLTSEAQNLTNALKNESKTRGRWGEMVLEKILESSGLIKDEHYTLQTSLRGEEKNRLQPDVIINLPENKHIIIDSKVSLVDYDKYCSTEESSEREAFLCRHIASIKNHVTNLSSKEYQKAFGINPPDFVLMFVPIEAALVVALERDRELFVYAWNNNIAIISATTLIPTLKIIHNIWRQESQNKNALAIAETGGKLYDKFVGFINDLQDIGGYLDKTKESYEKAFSKLVTGRGNIISQAEKMKTMGAKAAKQLPADLQGESEA